MNNILARSCRLDQRGTTSEPNASEARAIVNFVDWSVGCWVNDTL